MTPFFTENHTIKTTVKQWKFSTLVKILKIESYKDLSENHAGEKVFLLIKIIIIIIIKLQIYV